MRAVGLVEVLTALGALFKKRTGAFVAGFSFCKRGLRAARVRRGRLQPGFEGRGIDLVEHVAAFTSAPSVKAIFLRMPLTWDLTSTSRPPSAWPSSVIQRGWSAASTVRVQQERGARTVFGAVVLFRSRREA